MCVQRTVVVVHRSNKEKIDDYILLRTHIYGKREVCVVFISSDDKVTINSRKATVFYKYTNNAKFFLRTLKNHNKILNPTE